MWVKIITVTCLVEFCVMHVIVNTQNGPIKGAVKESAFGSSYFSFQRIPYMKPPIAHLRFRDPKPIENWTEVLDCSREGPRFPQVDFTFEEQDAPFRGELDSMHINVYTNNLNPTEKYPVMVFIHGGGFRTGSGLTEIYGPDYLIDRNVTLVTFNYRLYAFGFLSLDDPELGIPGNAGLKDQTLALIWIKNNIENFGGDPQNITIFGQSSGGGCAHYHLISPLSKGLFQRSIIMSGSAFNPMYAAIPRRNWAYRLASAINDSISTNEREILEFLEQADPKDIFKAVGNLLTPYERNVERLLNAFGPVIEPYDNGNAFMLNHPEELARNSWGNDIDIMIGATSFENGMLVPLFLQFPQFVEPSSNFTSYVPYSISMTQEERIKYGEKLKEVYYGLMEPSPTNFDPTIILTGDFAFWHVIDRVIQQRIQSRGSGSNFVYRFDANADNNCFRARSRIDSRWHGHQRAIHMDDLCYLFKPSFATAPNRNSTSFELIDRMTSIFADFAGSSSIPGWNSSNRIESTLVGFNIRENRSLDTFNELPESIRMPIWREMYINNSNINLSSVFLIITSFTFNILRQM